MRMSILQKLVQKFIIFRKVIKIKVKFNNNNHNSISSNNNNNNFSNSINYRMKV
jgi:hypothetical protein